MLPLQGLRLTELWLQALDISGWWKPSSKPWHILHQPRVQRDGDNKLPEAALTLKFNRALLCGCLQMMMVGTSRTTTSSATAEIQPTLASFSAFTLRVRTTQMIVIRVAAREEAVSVLHSAWLYRPTPPWQLPGLQG